MHAPHAKGRHAISSSTPQEQPMLTGCVPWPKELAERYRREGYWRGETLATLLRSREDGQGARIAVIAGDRRLTFDALDRRADRLAAGLRERGLRAGDRVVVQLPNVPEFVTLSVALFRLGALPVFALPAHRRSEIAYLCAHAQATAYVIPDVFQGFDYRPLAAEVRAGTATLRDVLVVGHPADDFIALSEVDAEPVELPPPSPQEVAFFLLSGGTTGAPKLIPRTHDDYAYQLRTTAADMGFDETGVYLAALPVAHNAALGCPGLLGALRAGGRVVLASSPSPGDIFPLIAREGVTLTTLMPSLLSLWMETASLFPMDLSRLVIEVGGARLAPEVALAVRTTLRCTLSHWFGMAEGLLCHTRLDDPDDVIAHTQGQPICPADELRVVDDADQPVPVGTPGQLLVRGPYTLRGYYGVPQYNATAFTRDGFLRTGDLVRLTTEGRLAVEGRVKDVVNRGGEKVPAGELEEHLLAYPTVQRAAVLSVPDAMMGEKTCAVIVAATPVPTLAELREFLSVCGLAHYKLPDRLEIVDELPYTSLGKVNKIKLLESLGHRLPPSARSTTTAG
jgi:2,3-dihydroxybenzoate-AMP ligase